MADDRRVALAALAVTAIVGLGAPIGTVIATNAHDDHQLHNEQAQADRIELRKVLDEAGASLYATRRELLPTASRVASFRRARRPGAIAPLQARLDRVVENLTRLTIRVGGRAAVTTRMETALSTVANLSPDLLTARDPISMALDKRDRFARAIGSFIEEAHRLAAATTT